MWSSHQPTHIYSVLAILHFTLLILTLGDARENGMKVQLHRVRVRRSLACNAAPAVRDNESPSLTEKKQVDVQKNVPDHPEWAYLNGIPWYKIDSTQQDQARFHCYLAMASYGDYRNDCSKTFTKGFKVLQDFNTSLGQSGYIAEIQEMGRVTIVFKGFREYRTLDWDSMPVGGMISNCSGCEVAKGVYDLYLSAKEVTNDFEVAKTHVKKSGLKLSVTGHGIGGAVSTLAALDLGSRNLVHQVFNQGMPRAFNYASVVRYDNLFQALASQSLVSTNDFMVQAIPIGTFYHVGTKAQINGPEQQWLINCYGNNENYTCTGDGSDTSIHKNYYTPLGTCGKNA